MPSTDVARLLRGLGVRALMLGLLLGTTGAPLAALIALLAGVGLLVQSDVELSRRGGAAAPEPPGWRAPATGRPDGSAW